MDGASTASMYGRKQRVWISLALDFTKKLRLHPTISTFSFVVVVFTMQALRMECAVCVGRVFL